MRVLKDNEIGIDKAQLESLLNQIETLKAERKQLYAASINVFEIIGMAENGQIKVKAGGFHFMDCIKGAKPTIMLLLQASVSKRAEEKLAEKFAFFKPLIPLFEKINDEVKNEM